MKTGNFNHLKSIIIYQQCGFRLCILGCVWRDPVQVSKYSSGVGKFAGTKLRRVQDGFEMLYNYSERKYIAQSFWTCSKVKPHDCKPLQLMWGNWEPTNISRHFGDSCLRVAVVAVVAVHQLQQLQLQLSKKLKLPLFNELQNILFS